MKQTANTFILCLIVLFFSACEKKTDVKESIILKNKMIDSITEKNLDDESEIVEREALLYSYDKTVKMLKQRDRGAFDFKKDLKLTYSIAMHTDSFFMVTYQPPNYRGDLFGVDISTPDWQAVKNEIIDLYERAQFPGIECNISYFRERYEVGKTIPILNFHASSYKFFNQLIKLENKVRFIDVNAAQLLLDAGANKQSDILFGCGDGGKYVSPMSRFLLNKPKSQVVNHLKNFSSNSVNIHSRFGNGYVHVTDALAAIP